MQNNETKSWVPVLLSEIVPLWTILTNVGRGTRREKTSATCSKTCAVPYTLFHIPCTIFLYLLSTRHFMSGSMSRNRPWNMEHSAGSRGTRHFCRLFATRSIFFGTKSLEWNKMMRSHDKVRSSHLESERRRRDNLI